jgi:hypothetical protein
MSFGSSVIRFYERILDTARELVNAPQTDEQYFAAAIALAGTVGDDPKPFPSAGPAHYRPRLGPSGSRAMDRPGWVIWGEDARASTAQRSSSTTSRGGWLVARAASSSASLEASDAEGERIALAHRPEHDLRPVVGKLSVKLVDALLAPPLGALEGLGGSLLVLEVAHRCGRVSLSIASPGHKPLGLLEAPVRLSPCRSTFADEPGEDPGGLMGQGLGPHPLGPGQVFSGNRERRLGQIQIPTVIGGPPRQDRLEGRPLLPKTAIEDEGVLSGGEGLGPVSLQGLHHGPGGRGRLDHPPAVVDLQLAAHRPGVGGEPPPALGHVTGLVVQGRAARTVERAQGATFEQVHLLAAKRRNVGR